MVQRHRPDDERAEAVLLWCGSLGFDGDLMEDFEKWADDTFGESAWEGDLVVGFITGLFVAQYIRECPDDA